MNIIVSNGEVLDKLSILEIKATFSKSEEQLKNINKEHQYLAKKAKKLLDDYFKLYVALKDVNLKLWRVEDKLREMEKDKAFNDQFIQLARSVYKLNDKRSKIKKEINILSKSEFIEEKLYDQHK